MNGEDRTEGTLLQRLWAVWRMKYITSIGQETQSCVFCDIAILPDGAENLIVHRGRTCYIVLNLYPYNNGHAMVIPHRHVASLAEMSDEEKLEMMQLADVLQRALVRTLDAEGFNCGMNLGRVAGAGIPGHVHLHVVPRWLGDTNFMPVTAETKVLPEKLEDTYHKVRLGIREVLEELASR
ncbi:MAG TPA: HIT domain-containing protein [bacterium]|nr:HIT domain-containing protein [bacterium]